MSIFSRLQRSIQNLPDDYKINREGLPNALNKMAKPEELKFSDIQNLLPQSNILTKNDFLEALHGRTDNMTSGQFSDPKFNDISLSPGHENYFEDVTTMDGLDYKSSHFDEPGYLSHTRGYKEDGTTFLEEIQSDLHQDARKKGGYSDPHIITPEDQALMDHQRKAYDDILEADMWGGHTDEMENALMAANEQLDALGYQQHHNGTYFGDRKDSRPPEAPHKNTWLKKGIEKHMAEGNPISVPISGDIGDLKRGEGVQKWYEDKVPATLEKLAKANNWDYSREGMPGAHPSFDERTLDVIEGIVDQVDLIREKADGAPTINEVYTQLRNIGVPESLAEDASFGMIEKDELMSTLKAKGTGVDYATITPNMGSNVKFEKYMAPALATGVGAGLMMNPGEAEASPLSNIANNQPPGQDKDFFRNTLPSDLEAIAAIGTGAIMEPLSGLAGIAGSILPGPQGQGADWVNQVQNMAYQPDDPSTLQQIGNALQYPMDLYEQGVNYLGDTAYDITGSPTIAALAKSSPEVLGGLFGIKQLMRGAK